LNNSEANDFLYIKIIDDIIKSKKINNLLSRTEQFLIFSEEDKKYSFNLDLFKKELSLEFLELFIVPLIKKEFE